MNDGVRTAGLNKPPLILKKAHTLTSKLNPYTNAVKIFCWLLGPPFTIERSLAWFVIMIWPENEKNRNMNVPTNSPDAATIWPSKVLTRFLAAGAGTS
jgi:hypothetical protein